MNPEEQPSILENIILTVRRRNLLPWWIKGFAILFMVVGALQVIAFVFTYITHDSIESLYGLEAAGRISWLGLFIMSLFIFKGITAWALWFEKDYAINLAMLDAIIGMFVCLIVMVVLPYVITGFDHTFRFELLLLIPYFVRLTKIKKRWEGNHSFT